MTAPHEVTRRMTQPARPRTPSAQQRATALATVALARPSGVGIRKARQQIAALAWSARTAGDWATYREVMGRLKELRSRTKEDGWKPSESEREARRHFRATSPAQRRREAEQHAGSLEAVPPLRDGRGTAEQVRQRQRDRERLGANALATALWAVHQGERDWTPLPTASTDSTRPPGEAPGTRPLGPAVLHVQVPESRYGPAHRLDLFKVDYDTLLNLWGYARVVKTQQLTNQLRAAAPASDLDALRALALDSARHPNLAQAWHAYVTGARLGDVFAEHSSGTIQLAPRRSGDLREAVLELYRQCAVHWAQGEP